MTTTTLRKILNGRPLHRIPPHASLEEAAKMMSKNAVGALAVLDDDTLLGILTERDIVFRGVARGLSMTETPVRTIMTDDPVTVEIDDAISDALARKLGDAFRHLPVMEAGRVVGLLSFRDIPPEYVMMFERFREMTSSRADDA